MGPTSIPVLTYHSVAYVTTASFRQFTVTPSRFAEHLAALRTAGWRTVTFTEAVAMLRGPSSAGEDRPPADRVVAVTVDDGLADFHTHALPLLAAERAAATLFVPTAHVGRTAGWLTGRDSRRRLLDWQALAELRSAGVEVGSHGHRHAPLDVGPAADIYEDLVRSRMLLEDRLGTAVTALAFPFGYQTATTRMAAQRAGFQAACAVIGLPATEHDHVLALPRLVVTQDMSGPDLLRTVERRYRPWERAWRQGKQQIWEVARRSGWVGPTLGADVERAAELTG
jgi:peptidoglycan/xylan/chitin deacetylase (PgdA/CDA1 family)